MKYMIMMFGGLGAAIESRPAEWIAGMHELLMKLDGELRETGELVAGPALVDPGQAKTIRFRNGVPVPTDGPFAEIKESLAGYWIVEASQDRPSRSPPRWSRTPSTPWKSGRSGTSHQSCDQPE